MPHSLSPPSPRNRLFPYLAVSLRVLLNQRYKQIHIDFARQSLDKTAALPFSPPPQSHLNTLRQIASPSLLQTAVLRQQLHDSPAQSLIIIDDLVVLIVVVVPHRVLSPLAAIAGFHVRVDEFHLRIGEAPISRDESPGSRKTNFRMIRKRTSLWMYSRTSLLQCVNNRQSMLG